MTDSELLRFLARNLEDEAFELTRSSERAVDHHNAGALTEQAGQLRAIARRLPKVDHPWPVRARRAFVALLGKPRPSLSDYRVLQGYLASGRPASWEPYFHVKNVIAAHDPGPQYEAA